MNITITRKQSFDDIKQPGDYITTKNYGGEDISGVALKCICGDIISLSNTVHSFKSYDPLDVHPSILHKRDDPGIRDCHYFIKEGKFIQA